MKILVTGGAGYIGSVTVKHLLEKGHEVKVFDNLLYGHEKAVTCPVIAGDLLDREFLYNSFANDTFDAVIHFAAYALAGESMQNPYKYFNANIQGGLNLLDFMQKKNIKKIVFSSTCAIFGTPGKLPVSEDDVKKPESVYGESKLVFEKILAWYDRIYAIKHVNLRYFNAAGATLDGKLGEDHNPETHIIPIAIKAVLGLQKTFKLYGNDYSTKDGTCVRDYIHVEDLAIAHLQVLELLVKTQKSDSFNLGTGIGYSNFDIINMVKKVSGVDFPIEITEKREGDPPKIYADNKKAKEILQFNPQYSDLETIVKTAWEWHRKTQNQELKARNSED